jgi:hypothetical protein
LLRVGVTSRAAAAWHERHYNPEWGPHSV